MIFRIPTDQFFALNDFDKRKYIKQMYDHRTPFIIERKGNFIDPYFVDWHRYLNDNEFNVFAACRCLNVPFFPQYPVGRFYLDYGNPFFKIGLEVDSITYHIRENDEKRDLELKELGWKIYHIESREAYHHYGDGFKDYDNYIDHEDMIDKYEKYLIHTLDGLLLSIKHVEMNNTTLSDFDGLAHKIASEHLIIEY